MSVVKLDGLTHRYASNAAPVFAGLNVEFRPSTMYVIMGPSGSGKSTLLSLIGLLMRPTGGHVAVDGVDAWHSARTAQTLRRSMFAWVLQNSACFEARTATDNVAAAMMARGAGLDVARRAAGQALGEVGLAERARARAGDLSGGEQQRMTIARALLGDRPIVLADEPTGQLDADNSVAVTDAIRTCATAGRVVIVATHDPAVADRCDQVLLLRQGRLAEASHV